MERGAGVLVERGKEMVRGNETAGCCVLNCKPVVQGDCQGCGERCRKT